MQESLNSGARSLLCCCLLVQRACGSLWFSAAEDTPRSSLAHPVQLEGDLKASGPPSEVLRVVCREGHHQNQEATPFQEG